MKEKIKQYLPYICGGLVLLFVVNLKKIRLFFEKRKAIVQTISAEGQRVQVQGTNVSVNIDTLASAIYYAFYNSNGKSRFNEDEDTAVINVQKCPKEYISSLSSLYAQKFGKILKDDLIARLSNRDWQKIAYLFNS